MGDEGDYWRAHREWEQKQKRQRRDAVTDEDYETARQCAINRGFDLIKVSDVQYRLEPLDGSWLLNIYPGNRRLYGDPNRPKRAPYLKIKHWLYLEEIIVAADEAVRKGD